MKRILLHIISPGIGAATLLIGADLSAQRTAETIDWSGRIAAGQTIEVKGVNGSITARRTAAAEMSAKRSGRRSDPNEVEIVVVPHSNGVTICAVPPSSGTRRNECRPGAEGRLSSNNNDAKVDFEIGVPSGVNFVGRMANGSVEADGLDARVDANTANGGISVRGGSVVSARAVNGSIDIESDGWAKARTTNGQIEATLRRLGDGMADTEFSTTNGSITLRIPRNASTSIHARTVNGRIRSDLPITVASSGRRTLSGEMGGGDVGVELRTTNGTIALEAIN